MMSSINFLLTEDEIVKLLEERARLYAERMQVRTKIDALYKQFQTEIDELPKRERPQGEDRTQGFMPVRMRTSR